MPETELGQKHLDSICNNFESEQLSMSGSRRLMWREHGVLLEGEWLKSQQYLGSKVGRCLCRPIISATSFPYIWESMPQEHTNNIYE